MSIADWLYIQKNYAATDIQYPGDIFSSDNYISEIENYNPSSKEDEDNIHQGENNGKPNNTYKTWDFIPRVKIVDTPTVLYEHLTHFYRKGSSNSTSVFKYMWQYESLNINFAIKHFDSNIKDIFNSIKNFYNENIYAETKYRKLSTGSYFPIWFPHLLMNDTVKFEWANCIFDYCNVMGKIVTTTMSMQAVLDEFNYWVKPEHKILTKPDATWWEFQVVMTNDWVKKMEMYESLEGTVSTCQKPENVDSYAKWYCDLMLSPTNWVGTIYNTAGKAEGRFVFRIMYDTSDQWWDASKFDKMYIVLDRLYAFHSFANKLTEYSWQIPYELMKLWYNVVCWESFRHGNWWAGWWTNVKASSWVDLSKNGTGKMRFDRLPVSLRTLARPCIYTTHSYYQDSTWVWVYTNPDRKLKIDFIKRNVAYIFSLK